MPRRLLACAGFSFWCFLNVWVEFAEGGTGYFQPAPPLRTIVLPMLCCQLVIAAAMLLIWRFVLDHPRLRRTAAIAFLVLSLFPAGMAAVAALRILPVRVGSPVHMPWFWPSALVVGAAALAAAFWKAVRSASIVQRIFAHSWPVVLLILGHVALSPMARSSAADFLDGPPAPRFFGTEPSVRLVWIVFDELGAPAIESATQPVPMVNFNRLRQVSLYATAAHAPGGETIVSIPGLILGDRVIDAKRTAPRTLMLTTASGNVSFSEPRNVFDDVRSLGLNTAIDGWYHPYGRLLSRGLTRCYWFPAWLRPELWPEPEASGLTELMLARMELQLVKMPGLGHFPMFAPTRSMRQAQVRGYQRWLRRAREYAADRSLGLVMLHVPVPHPPAIYSRARGTLSSEPGGSYLDNLALADRTLGDLRGLLEKDGLWDSTALLVTSDHGLRASVWNGMDEWSPAVAALAEADTTKVPFLFHLPRQAAAVRYDKPLNTLITRRLIVSFLRGEIRQPEQAAQFIGSLAAQP